MDSADDIALYGALDSAGKTYDTIENLAASGGRIRLLFDSDTTTSDFEYDFHHRRTAERVEDIVVKDDAAHDETIVRVFTDHDT